MNKFAFCAIAGALLSVTSSHVAQARPAKKQAAAKINWQPSYFAARKAARRSGKPLFIDFYTDWCGFCKDMDRTTYRNAKFIAYSRGWIMVKVNPEKSELGRQLAQKYRVDGFPTMIFTDGGGANHGQADGFSETFGLVSMMKRAAKRANGIRA